MYFEAVFQPLNDTDYNSEVSDFTGKKVVIFNTFNSRFKEEAFAKLRRLIKQRGGTVIDHVYIRRGRVLWQMSDQKLLDTSKKIAEHGAARWRRTL